MVVGNGNDIMERLMKLQASCPNCGTTLTFKEAAQLAKDSDIKENAVMCHNCHKAYTVNLTPTEMTFINEIKTNMQEVTESTDKKEDIAHAAGFNDTNTKPNNQFSPKQESMNNYRNVNTSQQKTEDDSLFAMFFYKKDVKTGEIRISKTKTISIIFFLITFIFFLMALVTDPSINDNPLALIMAALILVVISLLLTAPVFIVGYIISYVLDGQAEKNKQQQFNQQQFNQQMQNQQVQYQQYQQNAFEKPVEKENTIKQQDTLREKENTMEQYYEKDNMGTRHDTVEKANAYWLGERFQMEIKPPFTLYQFTSENDAEKALLELPYIHKAADTGNLICDEVYIFGCYKVSEGNYEAIICGKDLSYEDFILAEESFKKYGGKLKNNLEPEKSIRKTENKKEEKSESTLKFREKITQNQYTYECYDADTKKEALDFLKNRPVNQRLYYVCVYTPEGNYGRDIDGIYQM